MFVGRRKEAQAGSKAVAPSRAAEKAKDALVDLDVYLKRRDFSGAIALLRLNKDVQVPSTAASLTPWQKTTWWLAYCHFQSSAFAQALEYFDQLVNSESDNERQSADPTTSASESWRLSRACCLYYLQMFDEAEQAALRTPRHALCNRLLYLTAHQRKHGEGVLLDRYQQLSSSSPQDQIALAYTSFLQQNYEEVIDIYKRLLVSHRGELGALHVYLSMCYLKMDYYDVSLELLAVYLENHRDSFMATNLKACNYFHLYSGREAKQELDAFIKEHPSHPCALDSFSQNSAQDEMGMRDVVTHNMVVFEEAQNGSSVSSGSNALHMLRSLSGRIDEAQMNLVLFYLHQRDYERAFELVEDLEPSTPTENIVKAILHGAIGEQTDSKDHVFLAEKYFHAVGSFPKDIDTITGRQCMASYHILRKEFDEANVYLNSIAPYLIGNDAFNWNYGISLAASGNYSEAEEVLSRVQSESLKTQLTYCAWLSRCFIYNKTHADLAWELYLRMENASDALKLLKLIANDFYKMKNFYLAVKAFDVLERLDPDPEYWEAKRGACVGYFQLVATGEEPLRKARCEEVLKLLATSKNVLESSQLAAILKKWTLAMLPR